MTATTSAPVTRRSRFAVLGRSHDFRLLWIGQAASELGSAIAGVATPLLLLRLTGSTVAGGLAGTVSYLATWLFSIPGGYLADRYDRRWLMITTDLVRGVLAAVVAVAAARGLAVAWLLLACIAVSNCAWMAFGPAAAHAVRGVVPTDALPEAVSANQARTYVAGLAGPALGGALFAWSQSAPFVLDALSFGVSLACIAMIRTTLRPTISPGRGQSPRPSMRRALALFGTDPFLRTTTTYSTVMNFAVSALLYALILGLGTTANGAVVVGAGLSLATLTGLVGSLVAASLQRRYRLRSILLAVAGLRAAVLLAMAITGDPVAVAVAVASVTFGSPILGATMATARMQRVPAEMLGLVLGGTSFLASVMQPLTPLGVGLLLSAWSPSRVLILIAAICAGTAVFAWRAPGLDEPATAPPPAGHRSLSLPCDGA